jgi:hypothetical protein
VFKYGVLPGDATSFVNNIIFMNRCPFVFPDDADHNENVERYNEIIKKTDAALSAINRCIFEEYLYFDLFLSWHWAIVHLTFSSKMELLCQNIVYKRKTFGIPKH